VNQALANQALANQAAMQALPPMQFIDIALFATRDGG
jgi:hypothetical protein